MNVNRISASLRMGSSSSTKMALTLLSRRLNCCAENVPTPATITAIRKKVNSSLLASRLLINHCIVIPLYS